LWWRSSSMFRLSFQMLPDLFSVAFFFPDTLPFRHLLCSHQSETLLDAPPTWLTGSCTDFSQSLLSLRKEKRWSLEAHRAYIFVCIYPCVVIYMCNVCVSRCLYECMYIFLCIYVWVYMYMYRYIHLYVFVCICLCACVCMCVYMYLCLCTCGCGWKDEVGWANFYLMALLEAWVMEIFSVIGRLLD
jgi:hypothetical protein